MSDSDGELETPNLCNVLIQWTSGLSSGSGWVESTTDLPCPMIQMVLARTSHQRNLSIEEIEKSVSASTNIVWLSWYR